MKEIPLTQGQVALVDDCDYDWLNQWKWCARKHKGSGLWYAQRAEYSGGNARTITMHSLILGTSCGIDHRDLNGLNNCRSNIRKANKSQNGANTQKHRITNASSSFKGVSYCKATGRWKARVKVNWIERWLGRFDSEIEAAKAYDTAARKLFGDFARLNFPQASSVADETGRGVNQAA